MNNKRRKAIRKIIAQLIEDDVDLDDIRSDLEDLLAEEEEARDNTPENLLDSDAYTTREESCDHLQEAIDELDNVDEADPDYTYVVKALENIDGV